MATDPGHGADALRPSAEIAFGAPTTPQPMLPHEAKATETLGPVNAFIWYAIFGIGIGLLVGGAWMSFMTYFGPYEEHPAAVIDVDTHRIRRGQKVILELSATGLGAPDQQPSVAWTLHRSEPATHPLRAVVDNARPDVTMWTSTLSGRVIAIPELEIDRRDGGRFLNFWIATGVSLFAIAMAWFAILRERSATIAVPWFVGVVVGIVAGWIAMAEIL